MTSDVQRDNSSRARFSQRDTGDLALGLLNGFRNFPRFAPPAITHLIPADNRTSDEVPFKRQEEITIRIRLIFAQGHAFASL